MIRGCQAGRALFPAAALPGTDCHCRAFSAKPFQRDLCEAYGLPPQNALIPPFREFPARVPLCPAGPPCRQGARAFSQRPLEAGGSLPQGPSTAVRRRCAIVPLPGDGYYFTITPLLSSRPAPFPLSAFGPNAIAAAQNGKSRHRLAAVPLGKDEASPQVRPSETICCTAFWMLPRLCPAPFGRPLCGALSHRSLW